MALVGRAFVILFALLLAAIATAMVAAVAWLIFAAQILSGDPFEFMLLWALALFGAGITAFTGFVPTLIGIVVAEIFYIRSALVYALAGAALMLFGYLNAGLPSSKEESIDRPPPPISRAAEIAVAAGAVFGLTYWMIAGRRAGVWRGNG